MSADPRLFPKALQGFENAYAPYSNFQVGVAILAENGEVYGGSNVENAAYPIGNCAEASAIAAMIYGGAKEIREIMILGRSRNLVMPCGGCRQRLLEFCGEKSRIFVASPKGVEAEFTLDELIPYGFSKSNL